MLYVKVQRKYHTLPLVLSDVSYHWIPPTLLKWRRWMVRVNPLLCHKHLRTRHGWAVSGSGCRHPWILLLSARAHCRRTWRDCSGGRLDGWIMDAGRVEDRGLRSVWSSLARWSWVYCSGPRRREAILWEDVEPIHEWQHQEPWAGIQLHCQTAGRHGIYVHHSG